MQMGRMPPEDDAHLAQRLQEEFNSHGGARPRRSAASEAKKRLAEVLLALLSSQWSLCAYFLHQSLQMLSVLKAYPQA